MRNQSDSPETLDAFRISGKLIRLTDENGARLPVVLVVDDDMDSLALMCHVLEQFTCLPVFETNGQTALKMVQQHQPDLIILDIRLPGLNGLEIIRSLKCNKATQEIPIIAVTALAGKKNREEILCVGCDYYVTKPYLLSDIEKLICSFLSRAA